MPIGQAPQAVTYVPNAVPEGDGTQNLQPLGLAGQTAHIALVPGDRDDRATGASTAKKRIAKAQGADTAFGRDRGCVHR